MLLAALAAVLALLVVVYWNAGVARRARSVLDVFSASGFLQIAATILVVALALAVPGIAHVASALLSRVREIVGRRRGRIRGGGAVVVPLCLGALVITATVAYASIAFGKTVPLVLGDELLYADLAKSIATVGKPLVRGDLELGLSLGFPAFAAPAYRLAATGSDAYTAVQVMNAFAFALTALPAYAFARRLLGRPSSLAVALCTVVVPWLGYPAYVMTESLFYPVLTAFALVLAWTLDLSTGRRQAALLATLAVAVLVRPQGLALVIAVVAAVAADALLAGDRRATVRAYVPTLAVLGGGVVLAPFSERSGSSCRRAASPTCSTRPRRSGWRRSGRCAPPASSRSRSVSCRPSPQASRCGRSSAITVPDASGTPRSSSQPCR